MAEINPFDQIIGSYHAFFVHLPIILFSAALVCDLLNYFGKAKAFTAGHWFVIAATLSCIPAIITGLSAAVGYDANDPMLVKHLYLGYGTGVAGSFYSGMRISAMRWGLPLQSYHYVWLSIFMVALASWTSDYGILLINSKSN